MPGKPARYEVLLTHGAERDLESIHDYIAEFDGVQSARHVLDELMNAVQSLAQFPERGSYPRELIELGIREYRQALSKPYRLIYRVAPKRVVIVLIADGRRDMHSVLERRLLSD